MAYTVTRAHIFQNSLYFFFIKFISFKKNLKFLTKFQDIQILQRNVKI